MAFGLESNLLVDITIILTFATVIAYAARFLKQPPIFSYIVSGVLLGPLVFNLIKPTAELQTISHMGVAFLLYMVGMNLNFDILRRVGIVSLLTGLGQVIFTTAIGFLIASALGFGKVPALYIAIGLAFSSTIIIVKLLSDKKELDTLHGRISLGFLIFQDFIAIFVLIFVTGLTQQGPLGSVLLEFLFKGLFLVAIVFGFSEIILKRLFKFIAHSHELLFISGIAWLFLVSLIFAKMGFNIEMGAFLAGFSLSSIPYNTEIVRRIQPLRDFFIVVFFVLLGLPIAISSINQIIWPAIILSLLVLIGNPIIVMSVMGLNGYKRRTAFLCGLNVAQISEFSLIIAALGLSVGHVDSSIVSLLTLVATITIAVSTYFVLYGDKLYDLLSPYLGIFERKNTKEDLMSSYSELKEYDLVLFGGHRIGRSVVENFKKSKSKLLVIDFNPDIIDILKEKKIATLYADAANPELLNSLNFKKIKYVVSTTQNKEADLFILKHIKQENPNTKVVLTTIHMHEAIEFYKLGADYVILPYLLSGDEISHIINNSLRDKKYMNKARREHINFLKDSGLEDYQLTG